MKNEDNQKKELFKFLKEKPFTDKFSLSIQCICYILGVATLIQLIVNLINGKTELLRICVVCMGVFVISGLIIKFLNKKFKKNSKWNFSFRKKVIEFITDILEKASCLAFSLNKKAMNFILVTKINSIF